MGNQIPNNKNEIIKKYFDEITNTAKKLNVLNPMQKPGTKFGKKIGERIDKIFDVLF